MMMSSLDYKRGCFASVVAFKQHKVNVSSTAVHRHLHGAPAASILHGIICKFDK